MNIPERLYQYQSFNNYSLKNLKNGQIYFNSPLNFNDPYDCLHTINVKPLSDNLICKIYGDSNKSPQLEILANKIFNNSIFIDELIAYFQILFRKFEVQNRKTLENISIEEYTKELTQDLKTPEVFEKLKSDAIEKIKESVNRTIQLQVEIIRSEMVQNQGISCFSENIDDMLMWSYYSDGHKGFCLEFDSSFDPFSKAKKVKYVTNLPTFDPSFIFDKAKNKNSKNKDFIKLFFATKHIDWKRENEWRLLHKVAGTQYAYSSKALTGIYFGAKMDPVLREIILTILKSQNPFVKFYFMEKDPLSFKVVPIEMNYSTHLEGQQLFLSEIILNFKTQKFTIDELLNKTNPLFDKSKSETYLKNLMHLGIIVRNDNKFHVDFN